MLMVFVAGIGIAAACVRRDDGRSCDEIAKRGSRCVPSIAVRENTMPDQSGGLSEAFIAQQRTRLEALRRQLLGTEQGTIADERASQEEHGDEAEEFEDDAQGMAQDEINQSLRNTNDLRIGDIERALQKIDEGTYGFSDKSGDPIPKGRLEVMPEAIYTVEEQGRREAGN
jgi:DnaK suppressor protein